MNFKAHNVSNVNIICGYKSCHQLNIDILLNNGNSSINIECNDVQGCYYGKFIIQSNFSDNNIPQININCNGRWACYKNEINVVGINDAHLNCSDIRACFNLFLSSALLDQESSGTFDINCIYGNSVCDELVVNGISQKYIHVFCGYGNIGTDSCDNLKIYCPIYSSNTTINPTNWCSINLGNNIYDIEMYTIYNEIYPNVVNAPNNGNIQVFCDMDWLYTSIIGTSNNDYCLNSTEISQIQTIIPHQNALIVNCDFDNDCYIYMTKRNPTLHSINCPTNAFVCSVVWYVIY